MTPRSLFTWLMVFLVLCSFGASFALSQPVRRPGRMASGEFTPALMEYLSLTSEQEAKLQEFRKAAREERQAQFEQMRKMRTELRELMKDPQANEKKLEGLIDEMSKMRASQFKKAFKNAAEMKKIFTPEQLEKLEKFRSRMIDRRGAGMNHFMGRGGFHGRGWMNPRRGRGNFWQSGPANRKWDRW